MSSICNDQKIALSHQAVTAITLPLIQSGASNEEILDLLALVVGGVISLLTYADEGGPEPVDDVAAAGEVASKAIEISRRMLAAKKLLDASSQGSMH